MCTCILSVINRQIIGFHSIVIITLERLYMAGKLPVCWRKYKKWASFRHGFGFVFYFELWHAPWSCGGGDRLRLFLILIFLLVLFLIIIVLSIIVVWLRPQINGILSRNKSPFICLCGAWNIQAHLVCENKESWSSYGINTFLWQIYSSLFSVLPGSERYSMRCTSTFVTIYGYTCLHARISPSIPWRRFFLRYSSSISVSVVSVMSICTRSTGDIPSSKLSLKGTSQARRYSTLLFDLSQIQPLQMKD